MAAQLTTLFGVAAAFGTEHTNAAVLRAAGSLCDFGSERRAECLTALADVGAAPDGPLRKTVTELLWSGATALSGVNGAAKAALDVALTLLEASAQFDPFEPQSVEQVLSQTWGVTTRCMWWAAAGCTLTAIGC